MKAKRLRAGRNRSVEVQDKARQEKLRKLCGLRDSGQGRMGADAVDAGENEFELKSATGNNVTTARDVGPHTVKKWRKRYWIVARGRNLQSGFKVDSIYLLHPKDLEGWFRRLEGRFADDQRLLSHAKRCLRKAGYPTEAIDRLNYLVLRGITLNNPKIPWDYVNRFGTDITRSPRESIRKFVRRRPI